MKSDKRNRAFSQKNGCSRLVDSKESDIRQTLFEIASGYTAVKS